MEDMKFRKLYKDEAERPAERKPPAQDKPPEKPAGFFPRYRGFIGGGIIVLGTILFAMQGLSAGDPARPHSLPALLLVGEGVEDQAAAVGERPDDSQAPGTESTTIEEDESTQPDPAAEPPADQEAQSGETEPAPAVRQAPQISFAHYAAEPSEDLAKRFAELADSLELPPELVALRIQLVQSESIRIVEAGAAIPDPATDLPEPSQILMRIAADDAELLLGPLTGGGELAGRLFIGPFSTIAGGGALELVREGERRPIDAILPAEASGLQGFVIEPVAGGLRADALLLLPGEEMKVSEFYQILSSYWSELYNIGEDLLDRYGLEPVIRHIDYRHGPVVYTLAVAGSTLFLAGGFLLFFHIFAAVARKQRKEKGLVVNMLIDGCRLVTSRGGIYALVVGLQLFFWFWGMVHAYIDPAEQARVISWIQALFRGGGWPLGTGAWAYATGNFFIAALVTFVVNFVQGTFLWLTLPSLIPIAGGFIVNAMRNRFFGLALAPQSLLFGQKQAPHLLTVLIESQGYILAAFFSVLLLLALVKPARFGKESRLAAYKDLALWQFRILPLIAVVLLIGAVYEAVEILILQRFF